MEARDYTHTRTVLVEVDPQIDFISGSLAVAGGEEVITPLNRVSRKVRAKMGSVVISGDDHPPQTPHFDIWPVHCVAGTEGAKFHPDLEIEPEDIILAKGREQTDGYSATEGVGPNGETLESIIQPRGWENVAVYIGGLATDYCVKATALDLAEEFGHHPSVEIYALRDAMRAVNIDPADEAKALASMQNAGVKIITVEDALALIDSSRIEV